MFDCVIVVPTSSAYYFTLSILPLCACLCDLLSLSVSKYNRHLISRIKDLVVNDDVKFLRDLKLNQLIVHPLNPLHVATPSVVKLFAKTVAHYQVKGRRRLILTIALKSVKRSVN